MTGCAAVCLVLLSGCRYLRPKAQPETGGRMIPVPADANTVTVLVGRLLFRIPRTAKLTGGGANYGGYVLEYKPLDGKPIGQVVQAYFKELQVVNAGQHPEFTPDAGKGRPAVAFDYMDGLRRLELWQDLGNGGVMVATAEYGPGGKDPALKAIGAMLGSVVPVTPGQPIPSGLGMPGSVLSRPIKNEEVANLEITVPLPGFDPDRDAGLRVEMISDMTTDGSDAVDAKCRNGQLAQHELALQPGLPYAIKELRYDERSVAGMAGGETADLHTYPHAATPEVELDYKTDAAYPPPGHPLITIRANTLGMGKNASTDQILAMWDALLQSAVVVPMAAPPRGLLGGPPAGYKELPPCRTH